MGMLRELGAAASVVLFLVAASNANAGEYRNYRFESGEWTGAAYSDDRFTHCAMSGRYKSGITIFFSVGKDWTWKIGWSSRDWNFKGRSQVEVYYRIDGYEVRKAAATVVDENFIVANLPATTNVFNEFRKGFQLTIEVDDRQHKFSLEGTYAALTRLIDCVNDNNAVAARRDPPAVAKPAQPPQPPESSRAARGENRRGVTADQKIEAIKLMANVLAHRKMEGYRILSAAETKSLSPLTDDVDVVWRGGGSLGMLEILPKSSRENIAELPSRLIASDSKGCKGEFASGFKSDTFTAQVKRIFTVCREPGSVIAVHYTILPMEDGSTYLFSNLGLDSGKGENGNKQEIESVADADIALREAVYSVLKR